MVICFFNNNQAALGGLGGLVISASQINNSGNNISMNAALTTTGNITLAATKRLNAPSVYTNNIRPYANSELLITGLQTDNKTLSNMTISAPIITINNQFDALIPENCQIKMLGTLYFDNVITDSIIRGGYIIVDSKYTDNTATPLHLKGNEIEMTSSVNDIKIAVPVNKYIKLEGTVFVSDGKTSQIQADFIYGTTNSYVTTATLIVLRRLQSYMATITTTRNVRTTLFKNYGINNIITSLNTITPVLITTSNGPFVGSKAWNSGDIVSGDKLCLTLTGLLTTASGGSMNIYVYGGLTGSLVQATSFTTTNMALNNEVVKMTIDCDCIVTGANLTINNVAFCSLIRNANSTVNMVGTIGTTIPINGSPIFEINASHTILQASTFKLLTYSMEVY